MPKHWVTCVSCGKQFDANQAGYYNSQNRRYYCKKCGKQYNKNAKAHNRQAVKEKLQSQADEREARTGMRQSAGAMIAKIAIGALFIISSFGTGSVGGVLTGLVIGLALIAWGLVPYLQVKRARDADIEAGRDAQLAQENQEKRCPNCGAMTKGHTCEYCGSLLE